MDCGVQSAMLSVPPGGETGTQQSLAASVFAPPSIDQAQVEADKRAVYKWVSLFLLRIPVSSSNSRDFPFSPTKTSAVSPSGTPLRTLRTSDAILWPAIERCLQHGHPGLRPTPGEGPQTFFSQRTGNRWTGEWMRSGFTYILYTSHFDVARLEINVHVYFRW